LAPVVPFTPPVLNFSILILVACMASCINVLFSMSVFTSLKVVYSLLHRPSSKDIRVKDENPGKILFMTAMGSNASSLDLLMTNVNHLRAEYSGIVDVSVMHYREPDSSWMTKNRQWYDQNVQQAFHDPGQKIPLAAKVIHDFQMIADYSWIWLADDDINITQTRIPVLLTLANESGSPIVGPAITSPPGVYTRPPIRSDTAEFQDKTETDLLASLYNHLQCKPEGIECALQAPHPKCRFSYTSYVEVLAPLFRPKALWQSLHECKECYTDTSMWGLDLVWCSRAAKLYGLPTDKGCALIDQSPIIHMDGRSLPEHGPNQAQVEEQNFAQLYKMQRLYPEDFAGMLDHLKKLPECVALS